jgi:ADP-heptose:LPS heptosyltransferase
VLRHNPWSNQITVLEKWLPAFQSLKRERFDTVILLHASQRQILPLCSALGASRLIGTIGINKGLDSLFTDPVNNRHKHEIVRRLELIERAGAKRYTEQLSFFLQPYEEIPPFPSQTVALHPGSKDGFKRWPAEHFISVGKQLAAFGYSIVITGNGEEEPLMKQIASHIPRASLIDPTLSLRNFAARLKRVSLLISNDTGPVHLACALQTPVIALYSSTDPALCGPHRAENAIALSKRACCTPCLKRACLRPFCLLQIGPEEVVNKAIDLLKNSVCTILSPSPT